MITYGSTTLTSYNTITKIEVYYYKSTNATSLSGGSWSTTKPTWENGKYIWQKIRTTYEGKLENGQYYSESDPVNITGQQGATGTAAYSYKLNASDTSITVSKDGTYSKTSVTFSATSKQGTGAVNAYAGRFKIETTANGTTWTTQYTSSTNESSKEYTIPTGILNIRCSLYQAGGTSVLLDIVSVVIVADGKDGIDGTDGTSQNLLLDVYATSLDKVKAPWDRYLSDTSNTTITGQFIAEDNLPDPNATHFYRITDSSASTKARGFTFYNGGTPPLLNGHTYKIGCWVRNHAGSPSITFYLGSVGSWTNRKIITNTNWEWIECVHTFGDTDPAINAQSSTYKRIYFYFGNSNVEGSSLDMCGFKVEEIQTNISTARNYLLKTENLDGWGVTGGTTISNGIATFPEVTANTWREFYPTKNFKYEIIRNKNIIFSVRVKADIGKICACSLCIGVDSTETAYARQKYTNNFVYFTGTGEWQTICVAIPISDEIFTSGSGTPNYNDCWVTVRIGAVNTYHNGFQATQPQFSLGTTATAWSIAPEDVEASMQEKVNNLEIGGRNLLRSSESMENWNLGTNSSIVDGEVTVIGSSSNWDGKINTLKMNLDLLDGETKYLLSFDYKSTEDTTPVIIIAGTSRYIEENEYTRTKYTNWISSITFPSTNGEWKRFTLPSRTISISDLTTGSGDVNSWYLQFCNHNDTTIVIKRFKLERGNKATDWTPAPEDVEDSIKAYAQSIQSQVDGMAEIHYGTVVPTLSNAPYTSWEDTATKDMHVDDLYYNTSTGYCYRFTKSGSTYSWTRIKDSDITAAATAASNANTAAGNAQTTANNANTLAGQKRRIFVTQPTPPYEVGDLWVEGSNGDIKKCKTARATGSYTASDWELASKYTDDTLASEANNKIDNLEIGSRNLLKGTASPNFVTTSAVYDSNWRGMSGGNGTFSIVEIDDSPVSNVNKTFRIMNNTTGNRDFVQFVEDFNINWGGQWVFSCYARGINSSVKALIRSWNSTDNNAALQYSQTIPETIWTKIIIKIPEDMQWNSTADSTDKLDFRFGISGAGSIEYIAPKLERGNKATDWSPAPEDTQADIDIAALKATSAYNTAVQARSEIVQTQQTLSLQIRDISVGGANLFERTKTFEGTANQSTAHDSFTEFVYKDLTVKSANTVTFGNQVVELSAYQYTDLTSNMWYSFSFYAKGNVDIGFMYAGTGNAVIDSIDVSWNNNTYTGFNTTSTSSNIIWLTPTNNWQRYSVVFHIEEQDITASHRLIGLYARPVNGYTELATENKDILITETGTDVHLIMEGNEVQICGYKLELGNKPTDWTPADNDKATYDNIISQINLSKEGIAIRADKIRLEGMITANEGFSIDEYGNMTANNGTFNGIFESYATEINENTFDLSINNGHIQFYNNDRTLTEDERYVGYIGGIRKNTSFIEGTTKNNDAITIGLYNNSDFLINAYDDTTPTPICEVLNYVTGKPTFDFWVPARIYDGNKLQMYSRYESHGSQIEFRRYSRNTGGYVSRGSLSLHSIQDNSDISDRLYLLSKNQGNDLAGDQFLYFAGKGLRYSSSGQPMRTGYVATDKYIVTQDFSLPNQTIAKNTSQNFTIDISRDGYTPIMCVPRVGGGSYAYHLSIYSWGISKNIATIYTHNNSSSYDVSDVTIRLQVLYKLTY